MHSLIIMHYHGARLRSNTSARQDEVPWRLAASLACMQAQRFTAHGHMRGQRRAGTSS
jgi:hypothetical protein